MIAASYFVLTVAVAPIAFGPVQFRISEMLKPLALFAPWFAPAFAIGTGFANLFSPFGAWDYLAMPIVDAAAAWVCWKLRRRPIAALVVQAVIISVGVAVFPLGLGARMPVWITLPGVLLSQLILLIGGWLVLWKPQQEIVQRYV